MKNRSTLLVALLFALIWGLTFVWSADLLQVYSPITVIFSRLALAAPLLWLFVRLTHRYQKIEKGDRKWMALATIAQPFFYFLGETYGIHYSGASLAAIMIACIPLLTPIATHYFFGEKIKGQQMLGIGISLVGILLLILKRDLSLVLHPLGLLCLLLAVASSIAYALCISKLSQKYHTFNIVFHQTYWGALLFLPLFLIFGWKEWIDVPPLGSHLLSIAQLGILGSGVAFFCYVYTIQQWGPVRAGLFTNLIPVVTVVGSYLLLQQKMSGQQLLGMGVVIAGLLVSQLRIKPKSGTL